MDYRQTLDYLYAQLPMYQRVGPAAYKANLNNTYALANHLGNPENKFKSIHIAGTNGKGSVAHLIASVLQEAGFKTGLCTSPHMKDFRERFKINGQMMPEEFIVDFVNKHQTFFAALKPSFFEMTIAMTFDYFASQKVDIAVIETGLGGRLDSTNIITPEVAVITNIGLDHKHLLGNTIESIAAEKAGIIKDNIPVIVGNTRKEAIDVITEKAAAKQAPVIFAREEYTVENLEQQLGPDIPLLSFTLKGVRGKRKSVKLSTTLTGKYQKDNICTVAAVMDMLDSQGNFKTDHQCFKDGLKNVVSNTGISGRWQVLQKRNPLIICDTGHNEDGITEVLENIRDLSWDHLHFVLGVVDDKDVEGMLNLLPAENTTYYFCRPDVPRGLHAEKLKRKAGKLYLQGVACESVNSALLKAKRNAGKDDLIFIGGSTFVVAEVV